MELIILLQRDKRFRMNAPSKLGATVQMGNFSRRAEFVKTLLKEFA